MLELVHVTKTFNLTGAAADERIALDNVSLQIKPGEFVTIIGGNGSGKSTTLNIVSGSLMPDKGKVLLNGFDVSKIPEYKRAAYFGRVFQDPMKGTAAEMSVLENLEVAYVRGRTHSPIKWGFSSSHKKYFVEELKRFGLGLEDRLNQKVGVMSGGQRQALTLLMATMRQRPSERVIKRDYVRFCEDDKEKAKLEVEEAFKTAKENRKAALLEVKALPKKQRKSRVVEIKAAYESEISKYDLTKQILLLDEHTAALDPKTARKVLELTDKTVRENRLTTLMVTHNMKDALTYGDRLIMFHLGHIILDVSGEKKNKLTVEDLLKMFEDADKKAEQ